MACVVNGGGGVGGSQREVTVEIVSDKADVQICRTCLAQSQIKNAKIKESYIISFLHTHTESMLVKLSINDRLTKKLNQVTAILSSKFLIMNTNWKTKNHKRHTTC